MPAHDPAHRPAAEQPPDRKNVTMPINLPADQQQPDTIPTPKTIRLRRTTTMAINLADAPPLPESPGANAPREIPRPPPPAAVKSETIRIALDKAVAGTPPPLDPKQVTMPVSEPVDPNAPTLVSSRRPALDRKDVTMPVTDLSAPDTPTIVQTRRPPPPAAGPGKKQTTRIVLTQELDAQAVAPPATINLKRPPGVPPAGSDAQAPTAYQTPDLSSAKNTTMPVQVEDEISTRPEDAKRATAPITSIPAPLGFVPTPRTIRLKAGERAAGPTAPSAAPTVRKTVKAETSKLDLQQPAEAVPPTQRKTIKIKRTERSGPRTVSLRRPADAAGAGAETAGRGETATTPDEGPGGLGLALAIMAAILAAGLAYLLAAQSLGPELALPVPSALL